jgi:hypothetical protein
MELQRREEMPRSPAPTTACLQLGYPLVPVLVQRDLRPPWEGGGRASLNAEAVAGGDVSKPGFAAAIWRELSVRLCQGNYLMYRHCLGCELGLLAGAFEYVCD